MKLAWVTSNPLTDHRSHSGSDLRRRTYRNRSFSHRERSERHREHERTRERERLRGEQIRGGAAEPGVFAAGLSSSSVSRHATVHHRDVPLSNIDVPQTNHLRHREANQPAANLLLRSQSHFTSQPLPNNAIQTERPPVRYPWTSRRGLHEFTYLNNISNLITNVW